MRGIGRRLDRLERAVGEHFSTATCPECGEEFRHAGDLALELVAAEWAREAGVGHEPPPTVARVVDHPHKALVAEVLRDIPALRDAR